MIGRPERSIPAVANVADTDAVIRSWLRGQAPEPPSAELLGTVVAAAAVRPASPGWLARWRGHHLPATPGEGRRRGPWIAALAALLLGAGTLAAIATGVRHDDDRAVIVAPSVSPDRSPRPTSSAPDAPDLSSGTLVPYMNAGDGYSMLLPLALRDTEQTPAAVTGYVPPAHGVRNFGSPRAGDGPALRISIGDPDGTIWLCDGTCKPVVVRTIQDLAEALVSTPRSYRDTDVPFDARLGSEMAFGEKADITNNCLGCPGARYHVFAIRDGRPIVLAFNYWNVTFGVEDGSFRPENVAAMLASFRIAAPGQSEAPPPVEPSYTYSCASFSVPDYEAELARRVRAGDRGSHSSSLSIWQPQCADDHGLVTRIRTVHDGETMAIEVGCPYQPLTCGGAPLRRTVLFHGTDLERASQAIDDAILMKNGRERVAVGERTALIWSRGARTNPLHMALIPDGDHLVVVAQLYGGGGQVNSRGDVIGSREAFLAFLVAMQFD